MLPTLARPLPFLYASTDVETQFTNRMDPEPRGRRWNGSGVQRFCDIREHRLRSVYEPSPDYLTTRNLQQKPQALALSTRRPSGRRRHGPSRTGKSRWPTGRPRALVQMATGSGKTFHGLLPSLRPDQACRGEAGAPLRGPEQPGTPDSEGVPGVHNPREEAPVQRALQRPATAIGAHRPVNKVCISINQRVYSILKGEELPPDPEELSDFDAATPQR